MKKKNVVTTALAVGLAAVLAFGGTFAYYQDSSKKVTNTIQPNYNSVTLKESDVDDNGSETDNTYEIVPGTTDTKDPVATVNYTLDSYVFLVVDETASELIDFEIDTSVWTQLDGYDNVWYTLVTAADADDSFDAAGNETVTVYTKDLNVLTDEKISYASSITNENMFVTDEMTGEVETDTNGNPVLIDSLTLNFQAYIIQATLADYADGNDGDGDGVEDNYATPQGAFLLTYYAAAVEEGNVAAIGMNVYETLQEAITAAGTGETVTLLADMELTNSTIRVEAGQEISLDLGGNTITVTDAEAGRVAFYNAGTITSLTNGSIVLESLETANSNMAYVVYNLGTIGELNIDANGGAWTVYVGGSGTIEEITGGTYINNLETNVAGFGLYITTNASVGEISGGEFQGTKAAVANYGRIGKISGGLFHGRYYDGETVTTLLPQYTIMYSGKIDTITGGTFFKGSTNIAQNMTTFNNALTNGDASLVQTDDTATIVYKKSASSTTTITYTGNYYIVVPSAITADEVVYTEAELVAALTDSGKSEVYLASDITLTSTLSVGSDVTFYGASISTADDSTSIEVTASGVTLTFFNDNDADEVATMVTPYTTGSGSVNATVTTIKVGENTYEVNGYGNIYQASIASADGLQAMGVFSLNMSETSSAANCTFTLAADIDMSGYTFTPMTAMHSTFDGSGYTISNLTIEDTEGTGHTGLFGYAGGVVIKNLTLENVTVSGDQAGAFVGRAEGTTLTDCTLAGDITVTYRSVTGDTWHGVGSFVGVGNDGTYTLYTASSYSATITAATTTSYCATNGWTAGGEYVGYYTGTTVSVSAAK